MSKRTAPPRIQQDPAIVTAPAIIAGERAKKTEPLEYGARTRNYVLQNGHHKNLTPAQNHRRTKKLRASGGAR